MKDGKRFGEETPLSLLPRGNRPAEGYFANKRGRLKKLNAKAAVKLHDKL
jgi:hypothetical protein